MLGPRDASPEPHDPHDHSVPLVNVRQDDADSAFRPSWSPPSSIHGRSSRDSAETRSASPKPAPNQHGFDAYAEHFDSKKQARTLLWKQGLRWLLVFSLLVLFVVVLKVFQDWGFRSNRRKSTFQAITTALALLIGLILADAFKGVATVVRWRLLAQKRQSIRRVDLLVGLENWINVLKLGYESWREPRMLLLCFTWLFMLLAAQAIVATVSVTFEVNDGTDWRGTYTTTDSVLASNLDCYFHVQAGADPTCGTPDVQQGIAHAYGEAITSFDCQSYHDISEVINWKDTNPRYFCRRDQDHQEFAYRFQEHNPGDDQNQYPYFTNRTITASSGPCTVWEESKPADMGDDTNGWPGAWHYYIAEHSNSSHEDEVTIPTAMGAVGGTTYIYRGTDIPQDEKEFSCGDRCIGMWVHKAARSGDTRDYSAQFYQCPITVSEVGNTGMKEHKIGNDVAKVAAASIALQGRFASATGKTIWMQYQFFPFGNSWEVHYKRPDEVGANMAEFAIGSIATMASQNPRITIPGTRPSLGSAVTVNWPFLLALLAAIAGGHALLVLAAVRAVRGVVVKDDSALAMARLLHPLLGGVGEGATAASGAKIATALEEKYPRGIVYGPRRAEASLDYRLDIGEDVDGGGMPRKRRPRHPDGRYL